MFRAMVSNKLMREIRSCDVNALLIKRLIKYMFILIAKLLFSN
jgi:hypothetical protein